MSGKPAGARREAIDTMRAKTTISERRACRPVGLTRSVLQYEAIPSEETQALQARIIDIAHERRRFGYRLIQMMLRREGVVVNHKRTYRLYREARLAVRKRKKCQRIAVPRIPLDQPRGPNEVWSMDFVFDAMASGKRIKCLTIVDDYSREAADILVDRVSQAITSREDSLRLAAFEGCH